jgi:hypothetical protein
MRDRGSLVELDVVTEGAEERRSGCGALLVVVAGAEATCAVDGVNA